MSSPDPAVARHERMQRRRRAFQAAFFVLFLCAPALDLLRFDLHEAQLWFLGQRWSLGIDAFRAGQASAAQTAISILLRGFLPAITVVVGFIAVAYRYGRLYCGWLCPHFSSVEMLNGLLHRAIGKLSLWDRAPTPRAGVQPDRRWWPVFALSCVALGFLWSVTLLTYLLPPREIWGGLLDASLTPNQARFLFIAWGLVTLEFAFARHLFCRFGCAVGLFQSLAWMANPKGLVVAFDPGRTADCRTCAPPHGWACNHACPMRLHPRNVKRLMFSCVQCGQCLKACSGSMAEQQRAPMLEWTIGVDALRESLHTRRRDAAASPLDRVR